MKRIGQVIATAVLMMAFLVPVAQAQVGFGSAVAASDGEVFIGEPGNRYASGFVYVYRLEAGRWVEVAQLTASDAADADGFGHAVLAGGDLLLVSAVTEERGVVYVLRRDGAGWAEDRRVTPSSAGEPEGFGT